MMEKSYNDISETIDEMLTYFNRLYSEHNEKLKEYTEKLFEINVRLDELARTKTLYSQNTDYRKSVFSPLSFTSSENDKENEIKTEIDNLKSDRAKYEYNISEETIYLKSLDKRIKRLNNSKKSLSEILDENEQKDLIIKSKDMKIKQHRLEEEEAKRKEEERKAREVSEQEAKEHLKNILMLQSYDQTYNAAVLEKKVKEVIASNNKKLDNVRGYIYSSPGRSNVLVDEISGSQKKLITILDETIDRLSFDVDDEQSLNNSLSDYLSEMQEEYPDVNIEEDIGVFIHKPDYVYYISLFKILDIVFDNIYQHANAKNIYISANERDGRMYFSIKDDGKGIPEDYLTKSKWYSGLNRAKEIIFLMSGTISIKNEEGTVVSFSFDYE